MMNSYNFTGEWSYNLTADGSVAYVMHICHLEDHEMYFTVAHNNTPDVILGFGHGNWSQNSMMFGGQSYEINNGSSAPRGFGVGMNMDVHKWYFHDTMGRSVEMAEGPKREVIEVKRCAIPYGMDVRGQYFSEFWEKKRAFHKEQRIKRRTRDRAKKKLARAERKKPKWQKYYEKFMELIGLQEGVPENPTNITDEEINAKFVYEKEAHFPNLFGKTFQNEKDGLTVTIMDEDNGCFNGQPLANITTVYYGMAVNSYVEKPDGSREGQFFVQIDKDEVMGSYMTRKEDANGETVEEIKGFTMKMADELVPCKETKVPIQTEPSEATCDSTGGKCDL